MRSGPFSTRILIKDRPITEYAHQGATYLEGRGGSDFELEFQNHTGSRVMAVFSVDGLSVINGTTADDKSPGYVVGPYATVRIPGWKLTNEKAAKFTFGSRGNSYAQVAVSSAVNCGVIGVMVWSEKVQSVGIYTTFVAGGLRGMMSNTVADGSAGPMGSGFSSGSTFSSTHADSAVTYTATAASASMDSAPVVKSAAVNNLGTGFGEATTFSTSTTTFDKNAVVETMVLYYDDARGLKARGIVIEKPVLSRYATTPNPFPGMNCIPPKGWKG